MSLEIGDLQLKIRELKEEILILKSAIDDSLQREKRFTDNANNLLTNFKKEVVEVCGTIVREEIDKEYKQKFETIFEEQSDRMNENIIYQKKGFNHAVDCLLKEMALLKKDKTFLLNLVISKLNINPDEFQKFGKNFDKNYPKDKVEQDFNNFKMIAYSDRKEVKKLLGEKV